MKKENKKTSKADVKKTQDRIILFTRIFGVSFFVLGLLIIFITAIVRSRGEEPQDDVLLFESSADTFTLDLNDEKILKEEYIVLNNIDEFNNLVSDIDTWYNESYTNYQVAVSEKENFNDDEKQDLLDKYKLLNDGRYNKIKELINGTEINENTFDKNSVIVIENVTMGSILQDYTLSDICLNDGNLNIHINKETYGVVGDKFTSLYFVVLEKKYVENNIIINVLNSSNNLPDVDYKPIIYIYPENDIDVEVKLGYKDLLTVSYPKYENGWNVRALKDGTLIDKNTNRELYALYYESNNKVKFNIQEDGFVIKGSDAASFLEEKLEILGLNSKEINEFIIYWLPILESNEYNYIRFASNEEINENMPLEVSPKPESVIRVLMTFKGLDKEIDVIPQQLTKVERKGYSVVEWGGTIIE